jgi:hypothetical protein
VFRCGRLLGASVLPFLIVSSATAQADKTPAGEVLHRFDYPAEHFSIDLPLNWKELDKATLAALRMATGQLLPNAPKFEFNHVYTDSDLASHGLVVMLTDQHLTDASFRDLDKIKGSFNDSVKGVLSGSIMNAGEAANFSYDKERHVLWAGSNASSLLTGEVRAIFGIYVTRVGTIAVQCYAKAAQFESFEQACRQMIRSVSIDPDVTMIAPPPLSPLLSMGTEEANAKYRELVERVKGGDFSVDLRVLRMACAKSSVCDARATPGDLAAMVVAEEEQRYADVVKIAERLINQGFINIEAHLSCSQAYSKLNNAEKAKFHMDVLTALFRSILDAGDGKTEATAYEAISVREQYDVLVSMGLPYLGNASSNKSIADGGHRYVRWEVRNPKTQENVMVFFNVDAMPPAK